LANPAEDVDLEAYAEQYAETARERPTSSQPPGVGASPASETETEKESEPSENRLINMNTPKLVGQD